MRQNVVGQWLNFGAATYEAAGSQFVLVHVQCRTATTSGRIIMYIAL